MVLVIVGKILNLWNCWLRMQFGTLALYSKSISFLGSGFTSKSFHFTVIYPEVNFYKNKKVWNIQYVFVKWINSCFSIYYNDLFSNNDLFSEYVWVVPKCIHCVMIVFHHQFSLLMLKIIFMSSWPFGFISHSSIALLIFWGLQGYRKLPWTVLVGTDTWRYFRGLYLEWWLSCE